MGLWIFFIVVQKCEKEKQDNPLSLQLQNNKNCPMGSITELLIVTQFCSNCGEIIMPNDFMKRSNNKKVIVKVWFLQTTD